MGLYTNLQLGLHHLVLEESLWLKHCSGLNSPPGKVFKKFKSMLRSQKPQGPMEQPSFPSWKFHGRNRKEKVTRK